MLSQLFDGHPELHAHPHELKVGHPKKFIWPTIDLHSDPERWFTVLFEDSVLDHFKHGYKKMEKYEDTFLFIFLPTVQRDIFFRYLKTASVITQRDVFDAYMTSYFCAWINNQNLSGEKKYVTAFTPRLSVERENMRMFFETYPDGRLISLVRDPKNWYPSARNHKTNKNKYDEICKAIDQWKESTEAMVRNKLEFNERVCLLRFEELVGETAAVMRYLSGFLGIEFKDILLTPTFNKTPIKPNTSFKLEPPSIMTSVLSRQNKLKPAELDYIEKTTGEIYARALSLADRIN